LKLAKQAALTTFSANSALSSLRSSTTGRPSEPRLEQRLADIQQLLSEELSWVEVELSAAARGGPAPATLAAQHLLSVGGKRVRPTALLLSAACFGPVTDAVRHLAVAAELVHSATLLHDDVIDEGLDRRGAPAARRLWGNGVSVLAGDLLLVHALERTELHRPEALPDLIVTLRKLVEGEIVQLRGRTELDLSEATYDVILRNKTASLFAWATRTGARTAGANPADQESMACFGEHLGVAFQLIDDVLDYTGERTGKTLLSDLREGKMTLPLVLAVAERPELVEQLSRIQRGDPAPVEAVCSSVVESGACEEVRRRANRYTELSVAALQRIELSTARALLEQVARQLAERAA
jgi:octaprenyl-diphosphate synthase